jgi:hypothetical protein
VICAPRLGDTFPDSLILQLTRFLENSILMAESEPPKNPDSIFRKSISNSIFDGIVIGFSPALIQLYLECSGYASGTSPHQIRQLEAGAKIDPNVDVTIDKSFHGLMTVRDLGHTQEFFTSFKRSHVTFVEFVQALAFVGSKLVRFEWPLEREFEYVVEHIESWQKPQAMSPEDVIPNEEEDVQDGPPLPPEKPEKHSRNR